MIKIDIISGFLGAGKTTLISKLLQDSFKDEKVIIIENEFGEIGIDSGFLKSTGIEIREMNSGCICCSLVGDFGKALQEVINKYVPDRVIIEPSGVGKLSDVKKAIFDAGKTLEQEVQIDAATAVVDVLKCKTYIKNFGEFYKDQIASAGAIILTRMDLEKATQEKVDEAIKLIREYNKDAVIVTTPITELNSAKILELMEKGSVDLAQVLLEEVKQEHDENCTCGCHDHHHDHDHEHEHEHHHDHDHEHEHEHEHHHDHDHEHEHHHDHDHEHEHHHDHDHEHEHHHDHDHEHEHHHDHDHEHEHHHDHDHEHEHHHDHDHEHEHHHHEHDENCTCGCHDHDHHHHHHHADDVFTSWGRETSRKYTGEEIENIVKEISESKEYGMILRAKGIVELNDGTWCYFDMVPGQFEVRSGEPEFTGRLCVIGSGLNEDKICELFRIK